MIFHTFIFLVLFFIFLFSSAKNIFFDAHSYHLSYKPFSFILFSSVFLHDIFEIRQVFSNIDERFLRKVVSISDNLIGISKLFLLFQQLLFFLHLISSFYLSSFEQFIPFFLSIFEFLILWFLRFFFLLTFSLFLLWSFPFFSFIFSFLSYVWCINLQFWFFLILIYNHLKEGCLKYSWLLRPLGW